MGMYEERMVAAGFNVRKFASIREYLEQPKVACIWYFTRLQLERFGDKTLAKAAELRKAVTFQKDFVGKLPADAKFFHPLPRDAKHPDLPFWLDNTDYNGWDLQSQNGYFTRIVLLGMLGGQLGADYQVDKCENTLKISTERWKSTLDHAVSPSPGVQPKQTPVGSTLRNATDFVKEIALKDTACISHIPGVDGMASGIVIERLAEGQEIEKIWSLMYMVRSVVGLNRIGGMGVYRLPRCPEKAAGFICIPDYDVDELQRAPLKKLAAMAPNSDLSIVSGGKILAKFELQVPPRIYNFPDISCKNENCISNPANMQHEVTPYFIRERSQDSKLADGSSTAWAFTCKYCERVHTFSEIWDYNFSREY